MNLSPPVHLTSELWEKETTSSCCDLDVDRDSEDRDRDGCERTWCVRGWQELGSQVGELSAAR